MKFKLGDKVRIAKKYQGKSLPSNGKHFDGDKNVSGFRYKTQNTKEIVYNIFHDCELNYYHEDELELVPTQTLYAYTDKKDEVHWTTRLYTKTTNYTRAEKFDKVIEL